MTQLRKTLDVAEQIYRSSGHTSAAVALNQLSNLCAECEAMSLTNFAKLLMKMPPQNF
jgi:hypothetical protein